MDWYLTIKRMYDRNLWTKQQVADGVYAGKITPEQYTEITGEEYVAAEVAPFSAAE
jgi:uncharacterized XkdX family phage protein